MSFQQTRTTRRESRTLVGRFRGGKLAPVMATAVRGNEGGMLSQSITYELDPIAGRMITAMYGEFISVFVPVQAADDFVHLFDAANRPRINAAALGNLSFGFKAEERVSGQQFFADDFGHTRVSCGGVFNGTRLAHNAAVNYLRQRKYHKAAKILASSTAITPALISQTVLERLNGVLDPDDRINGAVQLDIPSMQLPVAGVGMSANSNGTVVLESDGSSNTYANGKTFYKDGVVGVSPNNNLLVEQTAAGLPMIFAQLNGAAAGNVSLTDFYNAEKMDRLTRTMQQMVTDNPEYGEEMVLRWAHGLSVDTGKTPFVIHEETRQLGRSIVPAMDSAGVAADTMRSDMMLQMSFSVPVPRTELGGIIITFATLKPDERGSFH